MCKQKTGKQVIVSWPPALTGWQVQTIHNFGTTHWGDYGGPVVNNSLTNPLSGGALFFRLTKA